MALQFREPPDWLIREYINRKQPAEIMNEGVGNAIDTYIRLKRESDLNRIAQQNADTNARRSDFEASEMAHRFGDTSVLGPELQHTIDNPAQGPVTEEGVGPQKPLLAQRWEAFLSKFPQGTEGARAERMAPKPLDDKRTYQEKQEIYDDAGNAIGYRVFDTRTGVKENRFYDEAPGSVQTGPKVKPQIPAASVEKTAGQKGFLDLIGNIEKNYKPEFVGPVQSRLRKAGQRYDAEAVGLPASTQAADFERDLADLRSAVINERTGAAVGERQEWDRLLELIPDDAKSDKDFLPKLQSFKERYAQIIANREEGFRKAKYRNQGSSVPSGMESMSDEELQRIANGG